MPYGGTFSYYNQPVKYGTQYQAAPPSISPTATASPNYSALPPAPTNYQLPPAPALPSIPPPTTSPFIGTLSNILKQFQTAQPFQQLSPEIANLLGASKTAAVAQFEDTRANALDQQLASLFGNGVERSTIAGDAAGRLSTQLAAARAQIEADAANRQLAAMQYAGGFGLQSLGQQAGIAGQGAQLDQNQYSQMINALLGQGSLQNQQYGIQSGNVLQQQGLAQNYALAQQQASQQLLSQLMDYFMRSGSGMLGGGGFGGGGFGGSTGFPSGSGSPSSGVPGQWPPTQSPSQTTAQQLQQQFYQTLMGLLQGFGG